MFAYNIHWNNNNSILLYPKTDSSPSDEYGNFHKGMKDGHGCTVGFVELVTPESELDRDIGQKLMAKIQNVEPVT
jgi:hypothetical protein